MKLFFKNVYYYLKLFGFDPIILFNPLKNSIVYFRDLIILRNRKGNNLDFPFGKLFPILNERNTESGIMNGHYFHQDLLIAKKIYNTNPIRHIDIGSRTDGFVAHVAVFREIEIIDIREQKSNVANIKFTQLDLMFLPVNMIECCDSISSLHAIEHFGLGRYGDPIDYNGHLKAISNITKMLKPGGKFYFSTPIGKQRIEFNAHRVFSIRYLINLFQNDFQIENFSYVNDFGDLFTDVKLNESDIKNNYGCTYGCGIFELIKK